MSHTPHFVLLGHQGCHNRGCEALVRALVIVLREQWPDASFAVVSSYPEHDRPLLAIDNVDIVPAVGILDPLLFPEPGVGGIARRTLRNVDRAARAFCPSLTPALNRLRREQRPAKTEDFRGTKHLQETLRGASAAISTGGDLFIEDYGPPVLAMEQLELAQHLGVPTLIWGASIWPLRTPWIERRLRDVLAKATLVTVRDDATVRYLKSLGVTRNVVQVADGAFLMPAQAPSPNLMPPIPTDARRLVGFNGSSLIRSYLPLAECRHAIAEMVAFFDELVVREQAALLLIPHDGPPGAREREFLFEFRQLLKNKARYVLLPPGLNAPETKYCIGRTDLFISMRFHPSIAAISQGVPTLGLAHSPKFEGLHTAVFGHARYLLPYREIGCANLWKKVATIRDEAAQIRQHLASRIPELQQSARRAGQYACAALSPPVGG